MSTTPVQFLDRNSDTQCRRPAGKPGRGRLAAGLIWLALLHCPGQALGAASATLAWDANPEGDIASYQLSFGTTPGDHPCIIDAGAATSAAVTGLAEGATYYFVVTAVNQAGLQSTPSEEIIYQTPAAPNTPTVLARDGWSVHYVDSEETVDYPATAAIDGNATTFWHTAFTAGATPPPHEIQLDLGAVYALSALRYLPRQDNYRVGNIGQYEIFVSTDGSNWGTPVAAGSFANDKTEKEVQFATTSGRYVCLRELTETSGSDEGNCAELNLIGMLADNLPPPPATSFNAWATAANLGSAASDPLASPHHDGVANLLKYAFAMSGDSPDVRVLQPGTGKAGLPHIQRALSGGTAVLRFEFLRRKNSTLIYTPRKTSDLKSWQPLSTSTPQSVTSVDSAWERVVITEPCDPATPVLFGRVEVMMPTS